MCTIFSNFAKNIENVHDLLKLCKKNIENVHNLSKVGKKYRKWSQSFKTLFVCCFVQTVFCEVFFYSIFAKCFLFYFFANCFFANPASRILAVYSHFHPSLRCPSSNVTSLLMTISIYRVFF